MIDNDTIFLRNVIISRNSSMAEGLVDVIEEILHQLSGKLWNIYSWEKTGIEKLDENYNS